MTKTEAIGFFEKLLLHVDTDAVMGIETTEAIQMAIKALEEPHWILCSETADLPDHEVLCCDRYGEELIGWLSYSDDQWLCESDGEIMYDPIAWCEKTEPWRGDEE